MEKQRKKSISVLVDLETYEALCQIAKEDSRTVSGLVFFWIRQRIRAHQESQLAGNQNHRFNRWFAQPL